MEIADTMIIPSPSAQVNEAITREHIDAASRLASDVGCDPRQVLPGLMEMRTSELAADPFDRSSERVLRKLVDNHGLVRADFDGGKTIHRDFIELQLREWCDDNLPTCTEEGGLCCLIELVDWNSLESVMQLNVKRRGRWFCVRFTLHEVRKTKMGQMVAVFDVECLT